MVLMAASAQANEAAAPEKKKTKVVKTVVVTTTVVEAPEESKPEPLPNFDAQYTNYDNVAQFAGLEANPADIANMVANPAGEDVQFDPYLDSAEVVSVAADPGNRADVPDSNPDVQFDNYLDELRVTGYIPEGARNDGLEDESDQAANPGNHDEQFSNYDIELTPRPFKVGNFIGDLQCSGCEGGAPRPTQTPKKVSALQNLYTNFGNYIICGNSSC